MSSHPLLRFNPLRWEGAQLIGTPYYDAFRYFADAFLWWMLLGGAEVRDVSIDWARSRVKVDLVYLLLLRLRERIYGFTVGLSVGN